MAIDATPPAGGSRLDDAILIVLFLLVLVAAVNRLPGMIFEKTGFDVLHPVESIKNSETLSDATSLGTHVVTTIGTDVFSAAQGGALIGFQAAHAAGTLIGGPEHIDGVRWWNVHFAQGVSGWVSEEALQNASGASFIRNVITTWTIIAFTFSFLLLTGLIYITVRLNQIRAGQTRKIKEAIPEEQVTEKNDRWDKVLQHVNSDAPNDWRLAIIEADVILDEIVTRMGYRGESLGAKLRQVDGSEFRSLEQAWEAHRIRNRIAHSGSDFVLTKREASRVIDLYARVFREFHFI